MIDFFCLSGGGNDFLALVEPTRDPSRQQIVSWCRRGLSVGADGLFILRRRSDLAVELAYWNSDGTAGDLCLNATRCAARLAHHLGWATDRLQIHTPAAAIKAQLHGDDQVEVHVPLPASEPAPRRLRLDNQEVEGWLLTIGVPHLVVTSSDSLAAIDVPSLGRALRYHSGLAPAGANVNFVRFPKTGTLEIRTYERGVENETLACGTGVLASTYVGLQNQQASLPMEVITLGGLPATVQGALEGGRLRSWSLIGDARLVASGTLHEGADIRAPKTEWSS